MPLRRAGLVHLLAVCAIILAGLAAYSNSLHGPFVYDDIPSIRENPSIRELWPIGAVLAPTHGSGFTHEGRPVLNLSLALNYCLGGTSVVGYHVTNLLIHLGAGLLLYGIVRRTLSDGRFKEARDPADATPTLVAAAVVLLWLLHPLQTEAVTYTVQRAESLMGFFFLLTFYGFVRYATSSGRPGWAVVSVVACLLGDGTKEIMVTAPVLVFLFDRTFFAGTFRGAWAARKGYFLALAASWIVLVSLVFSSGANRSGSAGFGAGISWTGYLLTQPEALIRYLALSFWPQPLVFDYGPLRSSISAAVLAGVPLLVLAVGTGYALVRRPVLGFLGFWFFGILAVTSLVPGSSEMIVERRMYLPLAAIAVLVVLGLHRLAGRYAFPVAAFCAVILGLVTFSRNEVYASDILLWKDSLASRPQNSRAEYNLGVAYSEHGESAAATAAYQRSTAIDPQNDRANLALANALTTAGRPREALPYYAAALATMPRSTLARLDLGKAYQALGQPEEAANQFRQVVTDEPSNAEAHANLGVALGQAGHLAAAVSEIRQAVGLNPALASARANLGAALAAQGQLGEAEAQFVAAVAIDPGFASAQVNLGNVLSQEGKFAEAVPHYRKALVSEPTNQELLRNLAVALLESGDATAAIPVFSEIVRQQPSSAEAHHNLGAALAQAGRNLEAQRELEAEARLAGK